MGQIQIETAVSIIIVNYKTKELVKNCINSIYKNTQDISFEIIVIDNNSQDGIQSMLQTEYPAVRFIQNPINSGFGAANNLGIKAAYGQYIFLLNPDTIVLNNAVKIFYDYCINHDNIGSLGGYLENTEGSIIHSYGIFLNCLSDIFYITGSTIKKIFFIKKRRASNFESVYEHPTEVDYITGADLFIPKAAIDKVGLFDENFFMYFEEADIQYKMSLLGLKRIIIMGPRIIHLEGKSFKVSNNRRIMINVSKLKYVLKHKNIFTYPCVKTIYLLTGITGLLADFYYKEYTLTENLKYIKCLLYKDYGLPKF